MKIINPEDLPEVLLLAVESGTPDQATYATPSAIILSAAAYLAGALLADIEAALAALEPLPVVHRSMLMEALKLAEAMENEWQTEQEDPA